jgi:hypothetical protein
VELWGLGASRSHALPAYYCSIKISMRKFTQRRGRCLAEVDGLVGSSLLFSSLVFSRMTWLASCQDPSDLMKTAPVGADGKIVYGNT